MQVKDIMTSDIACCTPRASLRDAAKLMNEHDCGIIPVLADEDDRTLKGVITDRDITARAVADGENPLEHTVEEYMSNEVFTVRPEDSVEDCCRVMREHQIRRVPVVDGEGACCGIVAQADLALGGARRATTSVVETVSEPTDAARR